MTEQQEPGDDWAVPVTFRVTTYRKLPRNEPGLTSWSSHRLCASEVLDLVLNQLPEDALTIDENTDANGDVTTLRINWAKVPAEIRYPFEHGVRRKGR
jgi:hypothetical protein